MTDDAQMVVQKPVVALLAKYKARIAAVVPKFMDDVRVLKLISGEIQRNPKLLECVPVSVLNCVVQAASLGLEIRPKVCYLVPLKNSRTGKMECNLWLDYRAEIDLIKRSGDATSVNAQVVYSKDPFEYYIDGDGVHLRHEPLKFRREGGENVPVSQGERGRPIGAYMLAQLAGSGVQIDFMSLDEIQQRQKLSKNQGADSPWVKHWDEMAAKTVIHHGSKMLRQTPELVRAQEIAERAEMGEGPEYIIDVEPEDIDTAQPFITQGNTDDQQAVAAQKINALESKQAENLQSDDMGLKAAAERYTREAEQQREKQRLEEEARAKKEQTGPAFSFGRKK